MTADKRTKERDKALLDEALKALEKEAPDMSGRSRIRGCQQIPNIASPWMLV